MQIRFSWREAVFVKDKKAGQLVDEISQPGQVQYEFGRREAGIN